MVVRWVAATAGVISLCAVLILHVRAADQRAGESKSSAKSEETIDTEQYAKAQLRLAELTLAKAQEFNRKIPRTLSSAVMDQFKSDVEVAKLQLERVARNGAIDAYQELLTRAEVDVRAAEAKLKAGQHSNQVVPGSVGAIDLERLKLNIDVARFQLERGKALASASAGEKLQWELEMLSSTFNKLRTQVMIISQNRLSEF